jgi:hypothetical protein
MVILRLSYSELTSRKCLLDGLLLELPGLRGVGARLPSSEVAMREELEGLSPRGAGRTTCNWLCGLCGRPILPEERVREERRDEDALDVGRGVRLEVLDVEHDERGRCWW